MRRSRLGIEIVRLIDHVAQRPADLVRVDALDNLEVLQIRIGHRVAVIEERPLVHGVEAQD